MSESTYITSDAGSSGDSLGIIHILERLDFSRKIGLICSTKVSKKGFSSTSKGDLRLNIGYFDSSDILEVIFILVHLLLATNLAFFYNIYSGLSTRYTNLVCCAVEVWWLLVLVSGWFSTLKRFKELGIFLKIKFRMLKVLKWKRSKKNRKPLNLKLPSWWAPDKRVQKGIAY